MNNDNFDAETKETLGQADALAAMFASAGWQVAEESLEGVIAALRDARNLPTENIEDNLKVNLAVADNLEAWVDELKGRVSNAIIMEEPDNKLITRR